MTHLESAEPKLSSRKTGQDMTGQKTLSAGV